MSTLRSSLTFRPCLARAIVSCASAMASLTAATAQENATLPPRKTAELAYVAVAMSRENHRMDFAVAAFNQFAIANPSATSDQAGAFAEQAKAQIDAADPYRDGLPEGVNGFTRAALIRMLRQMPEGAPKQALKAFQANQLDAVRGQPSAIVMEPLASDIRAESARRVAWEVFFTLNAYRTSLWAASGALTQGLGVDLADPPAQMILKGGLTRVTSLQASIGAIRNDGSLEVTASMAVSTLEGFHAAAAAEAAKAKGTGRIDTEQLHKSLNWAGGLVKAAFRDPKVAEGVMVTGHGIISVIGHVQDFDKNVATAAKAIEKVSKFVKIGQNSAKLAQLAGVAMTAWNVVGAVDAVLGFFQKKPPAEDPVLKGLAALQRQVAELGEYLDMRADRLDSAVAEAIKVMNDRFTEVDARLLLVEGKVDLVLKDLRQASGKLDLLNRDLHAFLEDMADDAFNAALTDHLDIALRPDRAPGYSQADFDAGQNVFYRQIQEKACESIYAGAPERKYDEDFLPTELAHGAAFNANFLANYPRFALSLPALTETRLCSPTAMIGGSRAYRMHAAQWPRHFANYPRFYTERVRDRFKDFRDMRAKGLARSDTPGGLVPNSKMWSALLGRQTGAVAIGLNKVDSLVGAFLAERASTLGGYQLFGGLNQATDFRVTSMPRRDGGGDLALPEGALAALAPHAMLASRIGPTRVRFSYEDAYWSEVETRTGSRVECSNIPFYHCRTYTYTYNVAHLNFTLVAWFGDRLLYRQRYRDPEATDMGSFPDQWLATYWESGRNFRASFPAGASSREYSPDTAAINAAMADQITEFFRTHQDALVLYLLDRLGNPEASVRNAFDRAGHYQVLVAQFLALIAEEYLHQSDLLRQMALNPVHGLFRTEGVAALLRERLGKAPIDQDLRAALRAEAVRRDSVMAVLMTAMVDSGALAANEIEEEYLALELLLQGSPAARTEAPDTSAPFVEATVRGDSAVVRWSPRRGSAVYGISFRGPGHSLDTLVADTSLVANLPWLFEGEVEVRAISGEGQGAPGSASIRVGASPLPPPRVLAPAESSEVGTDASLAWTGGAELYQVLVIAGGDTLFNARIPDTVIAKLPFRPGTEVAVTVTAWKGGRSSQPAAWSFHIRQVPPPPNPPGKVHGLAWGVEGDSLRLRWNAVRETDHYRILVTRMSDGNIEAAYSTEDTTQALPLSPKDIESGYYLAVRIRAVNGAGEGETAFLAISAPGSHPVSLIRRRPALHLMHRGGRIYGVDGRDVRARGIR